ADAAWQRTRGSGLPFTVDREIGAACKLPVDNPDDPDADDPDPFTWQYAAWLADQRDQAERRRLLYVGATRAQDYLIVSGSLNRLPEKSWLAQWIAALGIFEEDLTPDDEGAMLHFDWGRCALHVPQTVTLPDHLTAPDTDRPGWRDPVLADAIQSGTRIAGVDAALPPLLAAVPLDLAAPARALTATNLAALGRAQFYDPTARGQIAFRNAILHDAPDPVRPLPDRITGVQDLRRVIGEMVHRALQAWIMPDTTPREEILKRLRTYAWGAGLSDADQIETAAIEAAGLVQQFAHSPARMELDRAQQIYRELPFVYRVGERTIHGVIDVLYFDGKQWTVMDYKTAQVDYGAARHNAQRYYLQVGIYARAVEARTGQIPAAQLYYIHPARLITVTPEDWQPALDRLEDDLRAALGAQ
ncbi:MAG: PD-(D/E)XK nuclease family protein, partial [Anaerolineae bacterium]|nr:PD-(D/E)XK nuclease family protein [Anaerolineae bacterium]